MGLFKIVNNNMIVSIFKNMFHCFRKTDRRRPLQRAVGYVFVTRYVLIANERRQDRQKNVIRKCWSEQYRVQYTLEKTTL